MADQEVAQVDPPKKRMVKRRPARKQVSQPALASLLPTHYAHSHSHSHTHTLCAGGTWPDRKEGTATDRPDLQHVVPQMGQSPRSHSPTLTTADSPPSLQAGGDKYDSMGVQEKAQTRVDVKKDAGYTRADAGGNKYICLFFARGCCPYGQECTYLHRLPPRAHVLPDASLDVFGREKHAGYRDDMGGVGSFSRQNRTLYIGRIKETRDTPEIVEEHFSEFGEIERSEFLDRSVLFPLAQHCIRCAMANKGPARSSWFCLQDRVDPRSTYVCLAVKVLTNRGVAFVTYVQELNAQFAKEAMMHQSLDNDEVLNVRYAVSPLFFRSVPSHLERPVTYFRTLTPFHTHVGGRLKTRTRPQSEKSTSGCSPRARRASRSRSTPSLSSACANSTNSKARSLLPPLQNRRRSKSRGDLRLQERLRERRRRRMGTGSGRRSGRGSRLRPLRRRSSKRRLETTTLSLLLLPPHPLPPRRRHQRRGVSCPATRSRVSKSWRNCARSDCRKPKPPASPLLLLLPLPQRQRRNLRLGWAGSPRMGPTMSRTEGAYVGA
jgi:RNA recognition motif-containing protein